MCMSTVAATNLSAGFPAQIITTSIGKKILMAITGFVTIGFVTGHMLGNLQIFIGQDQINTYAAGLQSLGPILWIIRAFLFICFAVHVWFAIQLKLENWRARPVRYYKTSTIDATLSSRTMIWTGLLILTFVVLHLLHYTVRVLKPEFAHMPDVMGRHDVYSMVIVGFSNHFASILYIIGVALLTYHLTHGFASMFQSFGFNSPQWQKRLDVIAWIYSIFLFVGYAAIPVSVMLNLITLPGGGI